MSDSVGLSIDKLFFWLGLIFVISSFVLCWFPSHFVFDEIFHNYDIDRYYKYPISIESIREHYTPNGILSHILPRYFAKTIGFKNIVILRLFVWLCVLSSFVVLTFKRFSNDTLKLGFLVTICNPYSFLCSTTFMTEFIALGIVILGLILLQSDKNYKRYIGFLVIGLAIITRLYYLALIPAIFLPVLLRINSLKAFKQVFKDNLLPFILTISPLVFLLFAWKGLTPPALLAKGGEISKVSLNLPRLIVACIYIGFYSIPFLFFSFKFKEMELFKRPIYAVLILTISVLILMLLPNIFNLVDRPISTGIIFTFYKLYLVNYPRLAFFYNLIIVFVSLLSFSSLVSFVFKNWLIQNLGQSIAAFFVLFFLLQQVLVGGNIAFYERYILTSSFFLGMIFAIGKNGKLNFGFTISIIVLFLLSFLKALMVHLIIRVE